MKRRRHVARLAKAITAKMIAEAAPVTISAAADDSGPPSFTAIAYSGAVVSKNTASPRLDADYIIDLAGMERGKSVKVNLDHKPSQRVGHLTEFVNDGKQVAVSGLLSAATPYRDEVANSALGGYEWEVSIEASMENSRKLPKGKTAVVNGRNVAGPLYIFSRSKLTDLAFVAHGADNGNRVFIAASAAGEEPMNEFEEFCASIGVNLEDASDEQKSRLQAVFARQKAPGDQPQRKTLAQIADEQRQENERVEQINRICLEAMREFPLNIDNIKSLGDHAIEAKMSANDFELHIVRETRMRGRGQVISSLNRPERDPRVIEAAMCLASGLPNIEKHYSEQTLDYVDRAGLRNFSLQQLLMQVASGNGYVCRAGERIHTGNIRAILEHCFPPAVAKLAGFSSVSLPGILGNVANKMILQGYMEEDATWREIAAVKQVSNFHQHTHYRMLDSLEYEEVGSGGELKHGTLGQESYTSQAKTYGKMLGITRTQIINDDLGAFDDLRERLGRGAAKKFNNVFWAAFMDNSSFFTTALTNYIEGATTNLGTDGVGLQLGITAYRSMTTPTADGSKRMGVAAGRPTILLVPPVLEFNARRLFQSLNVQAAPTSGSFPDANIFAGLYRPVIQDRLSDSAFTGYSTTAWYLFGNNLKPMVVTFLNGQQSPTVESTDADFNVLGIQFRGYHDFGCDKSEYLAGIKSKGAT